MEFHEKLQELRKKRGLTQEELAKALFVSRTAVSKWESGKGYPSIDSLKELSRFFSVTIDELLSSEELISAAKDENASNLRDMTDLLFGITDTMHIMMLLLPLYPEPTGSTVAASSLFTLTHMTLSLRILLCVLMGVLIAAGAAKIVLNVRKMEKGRNAMTVVSLILSILTVLLLTMLRAPYAVTMAFLLLIVKAVMVFRSPKNSA
ncbi:MAG: helix-turn-helix transcriptional regulator [Oscillospiraceae bacterium]|nr:helix-turn-helix transcriptional regulator [Oscillospiraceae bacterium]